MIHTWGGGKTLIGKKNPPIPWGFTIQGNNSQENTSENFIEIIRNWNTDSHEVDF